MPKGPQGQKRPADVVRNIVQVMRIATGECEETTTAPKSAAAELGSKGGLKGGKARAKSLSAKKRSEIAKKAAAARWRR